MSCRILGYVLLAQLFMSTAHAEFSVNMPVKAVLKATGKITVGDLVVGDSARLSVSANSFCTSEDGNLQISKLTLVEQSSQPSIHTAFVIRPQIGGKATLELFPGTDYDMTQQKNVPVAKKPLYAELLNQLGRSIKCSKLSQLMDESLGFVTIDSIDGKRSIRELLDAYQALPDSK